MLHNQSNEIHTMPVLDHTDRSNQPGELEIAAARVAPRPMALQSGAMNRKPARSSMGMRMRCCLAVLVLHHLIWKLGMARQAMLGAGESDAGPKNVEPVVRRWSADAPVAPTSPDEARSA
jgi:hypothetical protein